MMKGVIDMKKLIAILLPLLMSASALTFGLMNALMI